MGLIGRSFHKRPERSVRQCPVCEREFTPYSSLQTACSRSCSVTAFHRRERATRLRPCRRCGINFAPTPSAISRHGGQFCSWLCYRAHVGERPAMLEATCAICGGTFRRTRAALGRVTNAYCSRECRAKGSAINQLGPLSPNWRGGHRGWRGPRWRELAEQIRKRDGYRCRYCGKPQEEGGRRLAVDHVLPFRSFATPDEANTPENLVAVCASCHGKKTRAESRWLQGDVLDMWRYQVAVAQPWENR